MKKEHQHVEWKESWHDESLKSICGFANAEGGVLVIGRNDKLEIWNAGQLPEHWSIEQFTAKHASAPCNPDIANAFFRVAFMEAWGRGIDLIRDACRAHDSPEPQFRWDNGLWAEFPFPVSATQETPVQTPVETPVKSEAKTPDRIIELLGANAEMTLADAAKAIGKSTSAVERAAAKLARTGRLRFVGPRKGGHWEVLK